MNEKKTEFRIVITTPDVHKIIDKLYDMMRVIQHEVLNEPAGFITIEAGTYIETTEEEEKKT